MKKKLLHEKACLSAESSGGRAVFEDEDEIRTSFQRDRDRIIHSKAFRRLKHKTQVFLAPQGDHYRTRLTHVLEVSQIARTVAKALRMLGEILFTPRRHRAIYWVRYDYRGIDDLGTADTGLLLCICIFMNFNPFVMKIRLELFP